MTRRTIALLMLASTVLGCAHTDPPRRSEDEQARAAAILSVAEPAIAKQYPDAYGQHRPYVAVRVPDTDIWDIRPVAGATPGAPVARVIAQPVPRLMSVDVAK